MYTLYEECRATRATGHTNYQLLYGWYYNFKSATLLLSSKDIILNVYVWCWDKDERMAGNILCGSNERNSICNENQWNCHSKHIFHVWWCWLPTKISSLHSHRSDVCNAFFAPFFHFPFDVGDIIECMLESY